MEEAWSSDASYIGIHIDYDAIQKLQLELTVMDILRAVATAPKLKSLIQVLPLRTSHLRMVLTPFEGYTRGLKI
jgi:hypothetical protein